MALKMHLIDVLEATDLNEVDLDTLAEILVEMREHSEAHTWNADNNMDHHMRSMCRVCKTNEKLDAWLKEVGWDGSVGEY